MAEEIGVEIRKIPKSWLVDRGWLGHETQEVGDMSLQDFTEALREYKREGSPGPLRSKLMRLDDPKDTEVLNDLVMLCIASQSHSSSRADYLRWRYDLRGTAGEPVLPKNLTMERPDDVLNIHEIFEEYSRKKLAARRRKDKTTSERITYGPEFLTILYPVNGGKADESQFMEWKRKYIDLPLFLNTKTVKQFFGKELKSLRIEEFFEPKNEIHIFFNFLHEYFFHFMDAEPRATVVDFSIKSILNDFKPNRSGTKEFLSKLNLGSLYNPHSAGSLQSMNQVWVVINEWACRYAIILHKFCDVLATDIGKAVHLSLDDVELTEGGEPRKFKFYSWFYVWRKMRHHFPHINPLMLKLFARYHPYSVPDKITRNQEVLKTKYTQMEIDNLVSGIDVTPCKPQPKSDLYPKTRRRKKNIYHEFAMNKILARRTKENYPKKGYFASYPKAQITLSSYWSFHRYKSWVKMFYDLDMTPVRSSKTQKVVDLKFAMKDHQENIEYFQEICDIYGYKKSKFEAWLLEEDGKYKPEGKKASLTITDFVSLCDDDADLYIAGYERCLQMGVFDT